MRTQDAIWAAVLQRVLNQIAEHPRQIEAITANRQVGQRIHLYLYVALLGQWRETLGDIEDKLVQMYDLAQFSGRTAIGPRQEKQIVYQLGHVLPLLLDHREGGALLVGDSGLFQQAAHLQFDDRQGCAQFVAGVGGELALAGERVCQPVKHVVELCPQAHPVHRAV